jgi:hypothetical protein
MSSVNFLALAFQLIPEANPPLRDLIIVFVQRRLSIPLTNAANLPQ